MAKGKIKDQIYYIDQEGVNKKWLNLGFRI